MTIFKEITKLGSLAILMSSISCGITKFGDSKSPGSSSPVSSDSSDAISGEVISNSPDTQEIPGAPGAGEVAPVAGAEPVVAVDPTTGEEMPVGDLENLDNNLDPEVAEALKGTSVGVKSGSQIYNTMLAVTGVAENVDITTAFDELIPSLPGFNHKINEFNSGHVSSILKLNVTICNALVDDAALRTTFFSTCDFSKAPAALVATDMQCMASALTEKFWGNNVDIGIAPAEQMQFVVGLLNDLKTGMTNQNDAANTLNLGKAACAHVSSSLPAIVL